MKQKDDPRHLERVTLIQSLFTDSFPGSTPTSISGVLKNIKDNLDKIDPIITQIAPAYPIEKIAKIDVAILRLAVFELIVAKKEPEKVIIDEAVELAKEFGNDESFSFINGVLGKLIKIKKYENS